jgi:putative peptidoglycan lipid II flippase
MSLIKKFASVGGSTLISRLFGFGRETLMASQLGTGPMADAFYTAFRLPNLFRRLFAEGAFNAAFVPLYAREIETNGVEGAKRFSEEVFGVLFSILLILTLVMELTMPWIVKYALVKGFETNSEKLAITVTLSMIMFPYLMCMSLTAMLSGMLNALNHFFAAAIAPVFLNFAMISALFWCIWFKKEPQTIAFFLSYAVLIAGFLQMLVVYIGVRKAGISLVFKRPRMTPNVKKLLILALPAAITGGVTQINQLFSQYIASSKEGAISALQLADRLYQLPLGIVGIAVGVVLLPELSRALRGGKNLEAASLQNRSIEFVLFLTLPAAAALFMISDEIIRLVYEHGRFTPVMTENVASTLAIYGLGLPGFVLIKALNPSFFAREDTKTPMRFTMIAIAVNCSLAFFLFPYFSERGIAFAEISSGWVSVMLLFFTLLKRGHFVADKALVGSILCIVVSTMLMSSALYGVSSKVEGLIMASSPFWDQCIAVFTLIGIGGAVYFLSYFSLNKIIFYTRKLL